MILILGWSRITCGESENFEMISPGSYRFCLENLILRRSRITCGESQNFEMISPVLITFALRHLGGWTGNGAKMIRPGSYSFRLEAFGRLHR